MNVMQSRGADQETLERVDHPAVISDAPGALATRNTDGRGTFGDREEEIRGMAAAAREVTRPERFDLTVQEKSREFERFLATMSHELRTPLNGILGFAGTLLMQLPGSLNDEQQRQLRTIQNGARDLLRLINDLLDVARIDSGKVELHLEPIECGALVKAVVESLRPLAQAKGLRLDVAVPEQPVELVSDRRALGQIVVNLVDNAIKFTEAGEVMVTLEDLGADIVVFVSDTGAGIGPGDQGRIFGAFERVDDEETERREGAGLGLYLSHRLAELLGGQIDLVSDHGRGSTFALRVERRRRKEHEDNSHS